MGVRKTMKEDLNSGGHEKSLEAQKVISNFELDQTQQFQDISNNKLYNAFMAGISFCRMLKISSFRFFDGVEVLSKFKF